MLLSQLPSQVIKPAMRQQAHTMKRKLVQGGAAQPWTAFQVQNNCNIVIGETHPRLASGWGRGLSMVSVTLTPTLNCEEARSPADAAAV